MAFSGDYQLAKPQLFSISLSPWTSLRRTQTFSTPLFPASSIPPKPKTLYLKPPPRASISSSSPNSQPRRFLRVDDPDTTCPNPTVTRAGRSKKTPGGRSPGRIEGSGEMRRQAKQAARKRGRRVAENLFYKRNNQGNQADQFTEEELQMIGLGYDRQVRFMSQDDPNLRHPYDWYKYGQYGPYSWRGIVVGPPIRGRFSDERVSLIGEVRDQEEWEKIEQFDLANEFGGRVEKLEAGGVGVRYFWVFVRHPKWKVFELPWQQWTLVAEVAVEAAPKQRLDKWSLMARLGNKARSLITQCAAWQRPDIIYVKRPVYQCRFELQHDFFRLLGPLLDPETEDQWLVELKDEEGRVVDVCTYFAGLCRLVKVNQKSFVDDVVDAYERLSEGDKSRCLEFLLSNHPMELLHPYTKEWKAKLEEMELGCDAPDESEDEADGNQVMDWVEIDEDEQSGGDDEYIDVGDEDEEGVEGEEYGHNERLGVKDEVSDPEESIEYWNKQWNAALKDSKAMEDLVTRKVEAAVEDEKRKKEMMNEQRNKEMEMMQRMAEDDANVIETMIKEEMQTEDKDETDAEETKPMGEAWEAVGYYPGTKKKVKKSRIPPELFLRAAVRPFTYRNLVKEIVLMRHAIIDQDIKPLV